MAKAKACVGCGRVVSSQRQRKRFVCRKCRHPKPKKVGSRAAKAVAAGRVTKF